MLVKVLEYPADTLHLYWPTDVHNQLRLSILRELCTIIGRNASINGYFRCSIVSVKLCKEYLNMATFEISVLLLIKSRTYWYTTAFIRHHIQELYTLKMCSFYWASLYINTARATACQWSQQQIGWQEFKLGESYPGAEHKLFIK